MNRLRTDIEEEETAQEPVVAEKPKKLNPDNFFVLLFTKGFVSPAAATQALPFVLYIAFLCMIYIANMHRTEKNIRDIDRLTTEVKELSWDFKTTKAEMAYKSTLSEVGKRADSLGIRESLTPPQKIVVKEEQQP